MQAQRQTLSIPKKSSDFVTTPAATFNKPKTKASVSKAFCPVCKNAGLSVEEYTNHWTRASPRPDAPVVCPTILNAVCSYCKGKGHFKKNCCMLKSNTEQKVVKKIETTTTNIPKNIYEVFRHNAKSVSQAPQKAMDFPPFGLKQTKTQEQDKVSYAEIAAIMPEPKKTNPKEPVTAQEVYVKLFSQKKEEPVKDLWINEEEEEEDYPKTYDIKQNWADNNYWSEDEF